MPRARNDNNAKQNAIQKGLFAFVLVICLGLLMVPKPEASPQAGLNDSPSAELGYGASRAAYEGLEP